MQRNKATSKCLAKGLGRGHCGVMIMTLINVQAIPDKVKMTPCRVCGQKFRMDKVLTSDV